MAEQARAVTGIADLSVVADRRYFKGLITRLGGQAIATPTKIKRGSTKENLIAAVDDEIDSIDGLYPRTLERIQP
jgi:hypothetical protein